MPGLLRGVARTAVIAGTATAVSNRVSRRQYGRWARQDEQAYEQQVGQAPPAATTPQPAPAAAAAPAEDTSRRLAQLADLGKLKAQGVLTEEEFQSEKARILAS
jgi:hypothetical protein